MCFDFGIVTAAVGSFLSQYGAAMSAATTVAATAVTGVGQAQAAKAQRQANEFNAEIAQQQALDAERRGSMAEAEHRTQAKRVIGAMRAQEGGSNVVTDTGSSLDVLAETAEYGARNAAVARLSGGRESFGFRSQAELDKYYGRTATALGSGRVMGTALTGTSKVFTDTSPWWTHWKQNNAVGRP